MKSHLRTASTTGGLPVAPDLDHPVPELLSPHRQGLLGTRVVWLGLAAIVLGAAAAPVAYGLIALINLLTNLCFHGRFSAASASPIGNHLGALIILVPVGGGLIVGLIARYGSQAIRGHGVPESIEQALFHESRVKPRYAVLKPVSAAIAIGTGGPFGAEGPIIATGGALGSVLGQLMTVTADERKTLLAAGAAAGMSATFGTPIAGVLIAVELLLFEYRARSLIPVALASVTAGAVRVYLLGAAPVFQQTAFGTPPLRVDVLLVVLGGVFGLVGVFASRLVYALEDGFRRLPIHWMWWPAIGALAIGLVGWISPATMGIGYDVIRHTLAGSLAAHTAFTIAALKLVSWSVSLASGTSGGTLAPLFNIGGGLGFAASLGLASAAPWLGLDPRLGALVGMAATFTGASQAFLTSVIFAVESTRQAVGLPAVLGGCAAAYLASCLVSRTSIMTEKIVRRIGRPVPTSLAPSPLDALQVRDVATYPAVALRAGETWEEAQRRLPAARDRQHRGYPVVDADGRLIGLVTDEEIRGAGDSRIGDIVKQPAARVAESVTLREATALMLAEDVDRLPVLAASGGELVGVVTRADVLRALQRTIAQHRERLLSWRLSRLARHDTKRRRRSPGRPH